MVRYIVLYEVRDVYRNFCQGGGGGGNGAVKESECVTDTPPYFEQNTQKKFHVYKRRAGCYQAHCM